MVSSHRRATLRPAALIQRALLHAALLLISFVCLLPLILVLSASFSSERAITEYGYTLLPREWSTFAYEYILTDPRQLVSAYSVTIGVTVIGTAAGLLIMAMLAYGLSRKQFVLRRPLSFYVFFTMLFNGGLVPWYILIVNYLQLKNSLAVLILPYLVVPWFVLLLRTYFAGLPDELFDAARIDGAGEWRIFFQIVLPLARPALATVGLFIALMYWNDWWLALLFIEDQRLIPLQYLLFNIMRTIDFLAASPQTVGVPVPVQPARMALAVLAIGPIIFAALFVQRYFVRGITIGAIKE